MESVRFVMDFNHQFSFVMVCYWIILKALDQMSPFGLTVALDLQLYISDYTETFRFKEYSTPVVKNTFWAIKENIATEKKQMWNFIVLTTPLYFFFLACS